MPQGKFCMQSWPLVKRVACTSPIRVCCWRRLKARRNGLPTASPLRAAPPSGAVLIICPYIICLRYFGANTMWYLQFHLVCARLSVSSFFLTLHSSFVLWVLGRQTCSHFTLEVYLFLLIGITFFESRALPVVFLQAIIAKSPETIEISELFVAKSNQTEQNWGKSKQKQYVGSVRQIGICWLYRCSNFN